MQEKTARNIVHAFAVIIWALTAVVLFTTISVLSRWNFFSSEGWMLYRGSPVMLVMFHLLLLVVFGITIGIGLWQKRNWGRILAIIFCSLIVIDSVIFLFAHPLGFMMLIIILASLISIYLLAWKKEIKGLFRR